MIPFLLAAGAALIVAAVIAAWPLLRRRAPLGDADRRAFNVDLYRQRIAELQHDRDAGLLSATDTESLTRELAATLLDDATAIDPNVARGERSVWAAIAIVVSIVAVSVALYHQLGAYDAVQLGEAAKVLRIAEPDPAALSDLVIRLRARVTKVPDEAESWYLLGHALLRQDDADGAVSAFERLSTLAGDDPSVQVALAQARFVAARGTITPANRQLIDRILAQDPRQPVALEMLALDAFRRTDYAGAAGYLENALAGGGADGPRAQALKEGLERARALMGTGVGSAAGVTPAPPPADASGPALDVTIELGAASQNLPSTAVLFVYARTPGQRMPLLVARRAVEGSSMTVRLDRTNAMQGAIALNEGQTLDVAARLSASGDLSAAANDLQAHRDAVTLRGGVTQVSLVLAAPTTPSVAGAAPPPSANDGAAGAVSVRLNVAFAPGIAATPPARVFVIARAPNGPPMPIAVRALDPATLPQQLVLTDLDAMQPTRSLSMFDRVEVLARLSRSGNPVRQPGDVESPSRLLDPRGTDTIALIIGG